MWHLRRLLRCVFTHNFTKYGTTFRSCTTWYQSRECKDCGKVEIRKVSSLLVSSLNLQDLQQKCRSKE